MKISPARSAAFSILFKIESERAFSSVLLAENEKQLSPSDRRLCHALTLGVLRKQMYLDRLIDHFAGGKKIDLAVRVSLRIGLHQLLFLDKIPDHSAVNESVNLVVRAKKSSARGFVNAVLRRALREKYEPDYSDDLERLSVETSHPRWLLKKWSDDLGFDSAAKIAAANNEQPLAAFRFTRRAGGERLLDGSRRSEHVPGCFIADAMTAEISTVAAAGEIYFQDEGSQLVGSAVKIPREGSFLDVCAAPGSKVTQIAAHGAGHLLVAGDIHHHRTRFLLENVRAQNVFKISVVEYDAEKALPFEDGNFDSVLVDAPCSGTGTIRHNPEIRYFLEPDDFAKLSGKQRRILQNASKLVRNGGTLYYSTCSLEIEENEAVADAFLAMNGDFEKVRPEVAERFLRNDYCARTMPHIDGMDGFFIVAFKKVLNRPPVR